MDMPKLYPENTKAANQLHRSYGNLSIASGLAATDVYSD